jgi:hypothetical protein
MTYGPITAAGEENSGHLLSFWHELGRLVAVQDNEKRAQAGWQRYAAHHTDGPVPTWEGLHEEERQHWIAAFTE